MDYPVTIYWSEPDGCYLAEVPDLPGCIADGMTEEEARRHAGESAERWVKMAQYMGREIPAPPYAPVPTLVST
jgi:predicted RNase H-like HicB family nuclease